MTSITPTLLDPLEAARASGHRIRLNTLDEVTEWFERAAALGEIAALVEVSEPPPWSPEPIDRRWRARGWAEEDLA